MKVAVLGAGSWGTALAGLLSKEGHAVSLWSFEQDLAQAINERRTIYIFLDLCSPSPLQRPILFPKL